MAAVVVWMDFEEAKLFKLAAGQGPEVLRIRRHGVKHHAEPHGKHPRHHADAEPYFKETEKALSGASEILLMGPGQAKDAFKSHLETHAAGLARAVVGVETSDHPTENQILQAARKFFKSYDLYHA